MKERGILFSAPMVRAILAGKKTQTRRVVNPQPAKLCRFEMNGAGTHALHIGSSFMPDDPTFCCVPLPRSGDYRLACPHGAPGDRLWVRETFSTDARSVYPCPPVWYRADFGNNDDPSDGEHSRGCDAGKTGKPVADCFACAGGLRWRPCLFMPRKLSRITLEIAEVRVQRLQDISEDDARSEGVLVSDAATAKQDTVDTHGMTPYRAAFACLWDSINGKAAPWSSNPWVWAITFPEAAMTIPPVLSADILRRIDELHANTPYDGRRVVLREERGGWRWAGLRGVCIRLANDRKSMVLKVEHCPDDYWPIGMEVLAELDHETVPYFTENQ